MLQNNENIRTNENNENQKCENIIKIIRGYNGKSFLYRSLQSAGKFRINNVNGMFNKKRKKVIL